MDYKSLREELALGGGGNSTTRCGPRCLVMVSRGGGDSG